MVDGDQPGMLDGPEPGLAVRLLGQLMQRLDEKTAIVAGTDHGAVVRALAQAGASRIVAIESSAERARLLASEFGEAHGVDVLHDLLGERDEVEAGGDGPGQAGGAAAPEGAAVDAAPADAAPGRQRMLGSLLAAGAIPASAGILWVDAERNDLLVLHGIGELRSAIVGLKFWNDGSDAMGKPAYHVREVTGFLARRGYSKLLVLRRRGRFETVELADGESQPGDWGHLIYIHDDVDAALTPTVIAAMTAAQQSLASSAAYFAAEAERRLSLVEALRDLQQERPSSALATRLDVLEEQELAIEEYLRLSGGEGTWRRWVVPQLGILYQHDPIPFHVHEHYLDAPPLETFPRISIVTPTRNSERFVHHTLNSVIEQAYPDVEYIVQDGDSSDETLKILQAYLPWLSRLSSEKDSGMAQAINRGFSYATGDIMAYLNSDDLLLPGALNFVAYYFATHPDVDVLYGHRVVINVNNSEIGRWVLPRHDGDVLSWADYVPQETMFWRRSIWDRIGASMDETFRFALDWDLLLRFREAGATFARVPRFLGAFRAHDEQKTSRELADLGSNEMKRLRERHAGRPVSGEEVWQHLQPYMNRHRVYHKLYRLGVLRY